MDELRTLRVRAAARRGIRLVSPDQEPCAEFPRVTFACDLRPVRCIECNAPSCPYTADGSNYGKDARRGP